MTMRRLCEHRYGNDSADGQQGLKNLHSEGWFRFLFLLNSSKLNACDCAQTHGASQQTCRRSLSQLLYLPDFP